MPYKTPTPTPTPNVRTLEKGKEVYINVSDLQKILYKDAIRLEEDGKTESSLYATIMGVNLSNIS